MTSNKNICDYWIVGAGYTGLSVARKLSEIDNKKNLSQKLLYPIEIGFSSSDIITIKSVKNILNHLGFAFTINKNNVNITSVHPAFEFEEVESIFLDIVEKN